MSARFLVINADDFGYSEERNKGIIDCFQKSCITSASLLVNGVRCDDAAILAKRHQLPIGKLGQMYRLSLIKWLYISIQTFRV